MRDRQADQLGDVEHATTPNTEDQVGLELVEHASRPEDLRLEWVGALAAALVLALSLPAQAGGSKADYQRAAAMGTKVRRAAPKTALRATWVGDDQLVVRTDAPSGTWQFERVDASTGKAAPAFDHGLVAKELGALMGKPLDAARLALQPIGLDGSALRVQVGARIFAISAESKAVRELRLSEAPELILPRSTRGRSKGGGDDTAILFVNASQKKVELVWLDHGGGQKAYESLAPGKQHQQHTFPGHVWRVRTMDGQVLGAYEARKTPGVVRIDGSLPPKAAPRRPAHRSPDGRWVLFRRDANVFLKNLASGKEQPLSTDGTPEDPYTGRWQWSPSSRYVMVVQEQRPQRHPVTVVDSVPGDQFQPKARTFNYLKPGDRIAKPRPRLFDVKTRKRIDFPETLFDSPWNITRFSWSAQGDRFRFLYNQRGHQALRLMELNPKTGKARAVIDERSETFIDYSQKTWLHETRDGKHWLWMSERSGWNHLYRIEDKSGDATPLTSGDWVVRRVLDVDEDEGQLLFEALGVHPGQDPYHVHVGRVPLKGGDVTWLTESDGTHTVRFSPTKAHYVATWSRIDQAPVHELRRSKDGSLVTELARTETTALATVGWRPSERFHAKGRDGKTDIWGILHYPSTFDPAKRYPVIEHIYAGPHDHFVPKGFRAWSGPRRMAELGFVVVQIDGMGTNWRSKAFHDVCWKNLGDSGFPDRIAWLRAAAKTRPFLDLERVGIYGGSAGGQSAMRALLAHPELYKVAVSDCGCHDNRMDKIWWNEAWMGWPIGPHYEEQSNITQAHKLEGKLFLIVGEVDSNVDPASTLKVVDALIKADKDFDLLVVPGHGHGAAGTPYAQRRQADFFVRHLLGVEPRHP